MIRITIITTIRRTTRSLRACLFCLFFIASLCHLLFFTIFKAFTVQLSSFVMAFTTHIQLFQSLPKVFIIFRLFFPVFQLFIFQSESHPTPTTTHLSFLPFANNFSWASSRPLPWVSWFSPLLSADDKNYNYCLYDNSPGSKTDKLFDFGSNAQKDSSISDKHPVRNIYRFYDATCGLLFTKRINM